MSKVKPAVSKTPIPDKRYFTIGEVAELCDIKAHVLRYWEQEFPQLRPLKRRGNRRYYQKKEVILVRRISQLLYEQGFTISGARTQLGLPVVTMASSSPGALNDTDRLSGLLEELDKIVGDLDAGIPSTDETAK